MATMTLSRRQALTTAAMAAGLAAAGAGPVAAIAAGDDPVFAAIAHHKAATEAYEAFVTRMSEMVDTTRGPDGQLVALPKEADALEEHHAEVEREAMRALVRTVPATLPGIIAMVAYARTEHDRGNQFLDEPDLITLIGSIEASLRAIASPYAQLAAEFGLPPEDFAKS